MYDVHATLVRLACRHADDAPEHCRRLSPGLDLLNQAIPEDRSCLEAGIPPKYCPLTSSSQLDYLALQRSAAAILRAWAKFVNTKLADYTKVFQAWCESLAPERFEVAQATVQGAQEYSVLIRRTSDHESGFFLDATLAQDMSVSFQDREWTIHSAVRSSAYAGEQCHAEIRPYVHEAVAGSLLQFCFCLLPGDAVPGIFCATAGHDSAIS